LSTQNTAADHAGLTSEVYALLVNAFGSTNERALNYWKSVWDITSQPYSPLTVDAVVRTNFDRANQLTDLTANELQSARRESAEFAEKLLADGAKVQEAALERFRGLLDTFAANLPYLKETTSEAFDGLSSRLKDLEKPAREAVKST
jgi:hypothetical protein